MENGENIAPGVTSNWSLVSPAKVGRSPGRALQNQLEDLHISASKFSVLSIDDEEEEGEIKEKELEGSREEAPESNGSKGEEKELEVAAHTSTNQEEEHATDKNVTKRVLSSAKGFKEKKANSVDTNPMAMSTRYSRRHL